MRQRKTIYILNHFTLATCETFQRRTRISQRKENECCYSITGWTLVSTWYIYGLSCLNFIRSPKQRKLEWRTCRQ